jgi:hypothetical protein
MQQRIMNLKTFIRKYKHTFSLIVGSLTILLSAGVILLFMFIPKEYIVVSSISILFIVFIYAAGRVILAAFLDIH